MRPDDKPISILIVDDHQDVAESLKDMLELHNPAYQVHTASNIDNALESFDAYEPCLAVLDIRLGRESGLDLLSKIKQHFPEIVCVMLTGYREAKYAAHAVVEGANDYLYKPVNEKQFLSLVDDYVDQFYSAREVTRTRTILEAITNAQDRLSMLCDKQGRIVYLPDSLRMTTLSRGGKLRVWQLPMIESCSAEIEQVFTQARSEGMAQLRSVTLGDGSECDILVSKIDFNDGGIYTITIQNVGIGEALYRRSQLQQISA